MPRYSLNEYTPETPQGSFQIGSRIRKEHKNYINTTESKKHFIEVTDQKREFISAFVDSRKDHGSRSEAGDMILNSTETDFPWLEKGLTGLNSMEIGSYSQGQGDDHFLQVLHSRAPNSQETSDLLDQVVELRQELEGRIREMSDFKDRIRELGKLLKADTSRQLQGNAKAHHQASS